LNENVRRFEAVSGLEANVRCTEARAFDVRKNVLDVRKVFRNWDGNGNAHRSRHPEPVRLVPVGVTSVRIPLSRNGR